MSTCFIKETWWWWCIAMSSGGSRILWQEREGSLPFHTLNFLSFPCPIVSPFSSPLFPFLPCFSSFSPAFLLFSCFSAAMRSPKSFQLLNKHAGVIDSSCAGTCQTDQLQRAIYWSLVYVLANPLIQPHPAAWPQPSLLLAVRTRSPLNMCVGMLGEWWCQRTCLCKSIVCKQWQV